MDTALPNLYAGPALPGMEPVRKYVLPVLCQATKDGARELVFGGMDQCANERVPIECRVQEKWYEMTPFPASVRPHLLARLGEMGAIPQDPRFPWEGVIEGDCDGLPLRWRLLITSDTAPLRLTNLRL